MHPTLVSELKEALIYSERWKREVAHVPPRLITDITDETPNCQDPAQAHFTHLEDVQFTYRKLTKTHEITSTSESNDWRRPQAS